MRIDYPLNSEFFVDIPDTWKGKHAGIAEDATNQASDKGLSRLLVNFSVSLALSDDFNLPGLTGKPEKWDIGEIDLPLIAWVNTTVYGSYLKCFEVPKNA